MIATLLTLRDIEELAQAALDEYGLTARGWRFGWDRAVRRAGCCNYRRRMITLSRPIFTIESNRDDALDTILHEVAHALVGAGAGHGPVWRREAVRIGARPQRCHSLDAPAGAVVGSCGCGPRHSMTRIPKAAYRCRDCSEVVHWARR